MKDRLLSRRSSASVAYVLLACIALLQAVRPPVLDGSTSDAQLHRVPPRRAVIFPPVLWNFVTLDQSADHVEAIANYAKRDAHDGLLDLIFPAIGDAHVATTRGSNSAIPGDPEALLLYASDAVITWAWYAEPLEHLGIPLVKIEIDRRSERASMLLQWGTIAKLTASQEREDWLVRRYDRQRTMIAGLPRGGIPTALFVTTLPNTFLLSDARESLEIAGGASPAGAPATGRVSDEQLLKIDPDFIFIPCCIGIEGTPGAFRDDRRFSSLRAVRSNHVYLEPSGSFHMEGLVQEPLLDRWLFELLHPEAARLFRQELREAYEAVYGYILDDRQIDQILHLDLNGRSAGFERFR